MVGKGRGKGKGSAFERFLSQKLSAWWTIGKEDAIFWRTSNSGGRSTVRSRGGKQDRFHHGDLCAIDPRGQPLLDLVTIELKKGYNRSTVADLLDRSVSAKEQCYEEWIRKALEIKERVGTMSWLLIVARDRREPLLFMGRELWDEISNVMLTTGDTFTRLEMEATINSEIVSFVGVTLQTFLDRITPKLITQVLRDWKYLKGKEKVV